MLTLLALTLQLQAAGAVQRPATSADSLHDVERAHDAQAGFERGRRYQLPWGSGSGGRCDVRVGRFCWWYEEGTTPPREPEEIGRRRAELLAELDTLGHRQPADPWIAGMRVYYRVDNRQPALADSAARECRAAPWWCSALVAFAAQARNDAAHADSGFAAALALMPDSTRCAWRDIAVVLPAGVRDRYEHQRCDERIPIEARYWLLSAPRLASAANEWRSEFLARRVIATLLANAVTPHPLGWGRDAEELLMRYGWPVAWSRALPEGLATSEPSILGHDPSPSFHYGPREALFDSTAANDGDGWALTDVHGDSRFAHPAVRRIATVAVQVARFRRGDSTLLVARWATGDDSLRAPAVALAAAFDSGAVVSIAADSAPAGQARVMLAAPPRLAGVELSDSASGAFARSRTLFAPARDSSSSIRLSDLLLFRPADDTPIPLDDALPRAIPGDTASVARPLGLYWETYGADTAGTVLETTIVIERIDHGIFRGFRQRLGLEDPDSPIRVHWSEAGPARDGMTPRSLSVDLSTVPAGRYRVTVITSPTAGRPATTSRDVRLGP